MRGKSSYSPNPIPTRTRSHSKSVRLRRTGKYPWCISIRTGCWGNTRIWPNTSANGAIGLPTPWPKRKQTATGSRMTNNYRERIARNENPFVATAVNELAGVNFGERRRGSRAERRPPRSPRFPRPGRRPRLAPPGENSQVVEREPKPLCEGQTPSVRQADRGGTASTHFWNRASNVSGPPPRWNWRSSALAIRSSK